jgi:hypothetical protein
MTREGGSSVSHSEPEEPDRTGPMGTPNPT